MSKYVYDMNGAYIGSFFDEIDDQDILNIHPGVIISNEFIEFPKLEGENVISMNKEEIEEYKFKEYEKGSYTLKGNEIVEGNKVVEVELKEYEYIENGILKFNGESKREFLLNKSKTYEQIEKEKSFEFKGFLQPNRELEDQTSLLKVINGLIMRKQTKFDFWKMKDKEGHEHYVSLTLQEMMSLGEQMTEQTTKAMMKWSKIREQIKVLTEEELKTYELPRE